MQISVFKISIFLIVSTVNYLAERLNIFDVPESKLERVVFEFFLTLCVFGIMVFGHNGSMIMGLERYGDGDHFKIVKLILIYQHS